MPSWIRTFFPLIGLVCICFISACDFTDEDVEPSDVAGEYIFTEFRFDPKSSLLPSVTVLDTLVQSNTRLQLFSSGLFALAYQFEGGNPEYIGGDFSVSNERVRLRGREEEEEFYQQLLLSPEITLQRSGQGTLTATIPRTVNLEEFSDRYIGLRTVDGVVELRLTRR